VYRAGMIEPFRRRTHARRMKSLISLPGVAFLILALAAPALRADTELLNNGHFNSGKDGWHLDNIEGAKGDFTVETATDGTSSAHVTVPEAASVPYHVQLFQDKLELKAGQTYHLSFRARANASINIGLNAMIAETPWTSLWKQDVSLTSDWQTYAFDITPTTSTTNGRVTFSRLAAQPADYWFADVSLTAAAAK
jgi:hypothetical protein